MLYPDINSQKKTQQTRYRTALYLRLSREDAEKFISASLICKAFYGKMEAQ